MPIVRHPATPLDWSIEKRGTSGQRYRLRFTGSQLKWISAWAEGQAGTPWRYMYWRVVWSRQRRNGAVPRSPQIKAAFADLGITDATAYIESRHVRLSNDR